MSELETVLAIANRAAHALEALPTTGGVVHLRGPDSCFLFGPAALDVTMAIIEWVTRWSRGARWSMAWHALGRKRLICGLSSSPGSTMTSLSLYDPTRARI